MVYRAVNLSEAEGRREPEGDVVENRIQEKEVLNDLKFVLKSERKLEKCLEHDSNENGNNLSLSCLYLGSLLCKRDCSNVYALLF